MKIIKLLICIICAFSAPAWAAQKQSSTPLIDAYNGFIKAHDDYIENLIKCSPLNRQQYKDNIALWQSTLSKSNVDEEEKNVLAQDKIKMFNDLVLLETNTKNNVAAARVNLVKDFKATIKAAATWTMGTYTAGCMAYVLLSRPTSHMQEFITRNAAFIATTGITCYSAFKIFQSAHKIYNAPKIKKQAEKYFVDKYFNDIKFAQDIFIDEYLIKEPGTVKLEYKK